MKKILMLLTLIICPPAVFADATSAPVLSILDLRPSLLDLNQGAPEICDARTVAAGAPRVKKTATHISPGGARWRLVSYGYTETEATKGLYRLSKACDAAADTSTNLIVIQG